LIQCEKTAAVTGAADQVIVGERRTVVAVGIRIDITAGQSAGRIQRPVGPLRGNLAGELDQLRIGERARQIAFGRRLDRQLVEYLLILHLRSALGAHALYRQIEVRSVFGRDVVVVDAGTEKFPGAGPHRPQAKRCTARFQSQRRRARAVDHAHDESLAAPMIEELFDGIAQRTRLPETAEHMLEFREARDQCRTIDGSAQRAADERGARRAESGDRLIRAAFFLDANPNISRCHQILSLACTLVNFTIVERRAARASRWTASHP